MFKDVVNKFKKKVIHEAKIAVKAAVEEEVKYGFNKSVPVILGLVVTGVTLFSVFKSSAPKEKILKETMNITINNYYYGGKP